MKKSLASLVVAILVLPTAGVRADFVPNAITGITATGHEDGDSSTGNGSLSRAVNGAGLTVGDPDDTATWTHNTAWQDDWQGDYGAGSAADGWMVLDIGAARGDLGSMFVWNVNEASHTDRGTSSFDVYYATAPTATPPSLPTTFTAYDFSSGGWTKLNTSPYAIAQGGTNLGQTVDLSPIGSARYIGIDILGNYGGTAPNRVGLAEVQIADAGDVTASSSSPTVDGIDIANLGGGAIDAGGDEGHIWTNRPVQGQTFTTTGGKVRLDAITLLNLNNNVSNTNFSLRIGTISGTTFSEIYSITDADLVSYAAGDYITFNLFEGVELDGGTLYGFEWTTTGSGFVTGNLAGSSYLGGTAYSSGSNHVPDDANLVFHSVDRVFHLDLVAIPAPAALPAGLALMTLGAARRRRR